MKKLHLIIITPYGKYLEEDVDFLNVRSSEYNLGILPNHTPLISSLAISIMEIKNNGVTNRYAISGGVINVEKDKVLVLPRSIEYEKDIDEQRAIGARDRARKRIEEAKKDTDINRAKLALARSINRLRLIGKEDV